MASAVNGAGGGPQVNPTPTVQFTQNTNPQGQDPVKALQDFFHQLQDNKKPGKSGGSGGADKSGGSDKSDLEKELEELLKLLKKLLDGDIKPEDLKKLAKMLGMKPDDVEKAKGAGEGDGAHDIKGG